MMNVLKTKKKARIFCILLAFVLGFANVNLVFADSQSEYREVIPFIYDDVDYFNEGIACVELNGKFGYIDKTGKKVTSFKYDGVTTFSEGLASVMVGEKWGYIDKTGKEVIPLKYDYWREQDIRGDSGFFSEGLAAVQLNDKWGYIDKTGKEVVPFKYDWAGNFSEGLAMVVLNGNWGYIDKTGKEVVSLKYDSAEDFSEGLATVALNGNWGYIDKTGKEVVSFKYDWAFNFSEGLAAVRIGTYGDRKIGYIDKTGKEVVPLKYVSAGNFSEGLAAVELNGKWGYIDKTGKEVVPLKYVSAGNFSEGLAAVNLNGKYGYIDKTGKEVVPFKYDWAYDFSEGLAAVRKNEKWGFISNTNDAIPLPNAVKSVPYEAKIEMANMNNPKIYLKSGNLPNGLYLKTNGEIGGAATLEGSFAFEVEAYDRNNLSQKQTKKLIITVEANTDENINAMTDAGYEITKPLPKDIDGTANKEFVSKGEFKTFVGVHIDGTEIEKEKDYTAEEGSTKITIKAKTFERFNAAGKHTIAATFKDSSGDKGVKKAVTNYTWTGNAADPKYIAGFVDVPVTSWFANNVKWAYERGLMFGTSATTFAPNDKSKTSTIVTILSRAAKTDMTPYKNAGKEWYSAPEAWAKEKGLISKDMPTSDVEISRGDLAVLLVNYLKFKGEELPTDAELAGIHFGDEKQMTPQQLAAFKVLYKLGVFKGKGADVKMDINAKTTRAETAALLERMKQYM